MTRDSYSPPSASYGQQQQHGSSEFPHSSSASSSLYPAHGDPAADGDSLYSQSPGRPTLYSDPSAPSLGRPVGGSTRASFETSGTQGTYDSPSSPVRGGSGLAGSPFNDAGGDGSSLRTRRPGAGPPAQRTESIFNSVYNNSNSSLAPPQRPFLDSSSSSTKSVPSRPLSVHYLPQKYPQPHRQGQWAHRRKTGGGRAAFAEHENRMPEDETATDGGDGKKKHKLLWNRFKWALFLADTVLLLYSIAALICCLLVWFNIWEGADTIRVANKDILILSTLAASFCLLTSLIGYAGVLLNNRAFLAVFTLFCWICFALIVVPGYLSYKKYEFNLEGKINRQWSRDLGTSGRLRIQNQLRCCGYYSPYVEATVSATCYSRSNLPGCKGRFLRFQRSVLRRWYVIAFSIVPVQVAIIIAGLLCSNHVTYRFTKGLTPKQYRLNLDSLAFVMDGYAGEIAAAYGPEVAIEAMSASQTNLAQLQYSNHAGHKSKSSWSGFGTPKGGSPFGTPNLSRVSLHNPPAAGGGHGEGGQSGDYRMSQLGSEVIATRDDDDDDQYDDDGHMVGDDGRKKGWYAGKAY